MTPNPCTRLLFAAIPLMLLAACGSDSTGNNAGTAAKTYGLPAGTLAGLDGVTTSLAPAKVRAGEPVTVKCFGQPGAIEIPEPEFNVTPAEGTKKDGATLTAEKVGFYKVACTLHDGNTVDANPAELQVIPADAVSIKTAVDPASILSGDKSAVTCSGVDKFGNAFGPQDAEWTIAVEPSDLADVGDGEVTGAVAGNGKVTCGLDGTTATDITGADLEVKPGKPAKAVTKLDPETIKAGGSSTVTCTVEDAAGNQLPADKATIDKPADVDLTGTTLTSKKKGKHEITCTVAGADIEKKSAELLVTAADPVDWKLVSTAKKTVWEFDDTIVLRGLGTDEFGNETLLLKVTMPPKIKGDPKGLSANPPAPKDPKSYSFKQDGKYTFTTTLLDFPALGERSLDALCDSEGPKVLISSPERGATLKGGKKVTVKGMVVDDWSGVKSFTIGGVDVKVNGDGSFSHVIDSPQGMTALIWKALDTNDRESHGVQSYYYSDKWYPVSMPGQATPFIDDGIGVWLGQQMIDSGKHNHKNPNDLATVVEIIVGTLDWDTLLGAAAQKINQPIGTAKFVATASVKNVKMGDKAFNGGYPEVAITVIDGGMNIIIKVHNFSADFVLDGKLDNPSPIPDLPVNQTITISAKSIEIQLDLLLKLDPKTGKVKSEAKNVDVNLTNFQFNVKGVVGILVNWLSNAIQPLTEAALEQVLKGIMQSMFGDQVGALLEQLALNLPLELPPFIGDGKPAKLALQSKIGRLTFYPTKAQAGGIIVGMDAAMTSDKGVKRKVLGSIGRAGCLVPEQLKKQVFNPGQKFPLELGLADDFVNQLLHALWWTGALSLTIDEKVIGDSVDLSTFGVKDLAVTTDFWLPPIVNTCMGGGVLKLQVGDLKLNAKLKLSDTPVDIDLFITLQAEAELKAVKDPKTGETQIGFALKQIDYLEMEIVNINAEAKNLEDLFVNLIKTVMVPKLVDSLGSGLGSFPLPAFDLSAFSPSIPKGTELALAIQKIENALGYTYIKGFFK